MKRSKFSLSHYKLLTGDMGYLIPVTWFEALPGDTVQQRTSMLIRVSPLLAPVMHPVRVRVHHWFVPMRLIWSDWEDFITGGSDGNNSSTPPFIRDPTIAESSLLDYLGVPPATYSGSFDISALPVRAYNLIFNEHYRDQDIVTEQTIDLTDGQDTTTNTSLLRVSWEKDRYTTSRPWEQKGTEVTIPLAGEAPVKGIAVPDAQTYPNSPNTGYRETPDVQDPTGNWSGGSPNLRVEGAQAGTGWPAIYADLTAATGMSINDLREALAKQRYMEARAQFGSRYVEYLRYLGIRSSDARLQNPEFLGGGRQVIQFSEVLATGGDDNGSNSSVGSLRGHGISAMRTNRYRRFFEEHGIVMSLLSVVPKSIYASGMHKFFSRSVKEDYFQKELQFMGEQIVENKEIYTEDSGPSDTFGYAPQYDEYRSLPSGIAGEFRTTLNHWHLARIFSSDVALNSTFIDCSPTKRVLASSATDGLYIMANHSIQARRMMSRFAKPRTF